MTPAEIYLQKARAKHRMLERSAEALPPEAQAFAVEVLAELSLAFSMLESQQPSRTGRTDPASMKLREEMMIELLEEAAPPAADATRPRPARSGAGS